MEIKIILHNNCFEMKTKWTKLQSDISRRYYYTLNTNEDFSVYSSISISHWRNSNIYPYLVDIINMNTVTTPYNAVYNTISRWIRFTSTSYIHKTFSRFKKVHCCLWRLYVAPMFTSRSLPRCLVIRWIGEEHVTKHLNIYYMSLYHLHWQKYTYVCELDILWMIYK